jgi:hypothetical protein
MSLCRTNSSGQCVTPPAASVTLDIAPNATPTFSVFLTSSTLIAPNAAASRVFVRFKDASGGLHGSTSVAVQSP